MEHNGKWNKKSVVTPEIIQEQGKASIIFQYLSGTWNHYRQMACLQWAAQQQKKDTFSNEMSEEGGGEKRVNGKICESCEKI